MPLEPRDDVEAIAFEAMQAGGYIPFDTGGGASAWALPIGGPFASWVMVVDEDATLITDPQYPANLCIMEEASGVPAEWGGDWTSSESFREDFKPGWDIADVVRTGVGLRYDYLLDAWKNAADNERSRSNREWLIGRIAVIACEDLKSLDREGNAGLSFAEIAQVAVQRFFGEQVGEDRRDPEFERDLIAAAEQVAKKEGYYRDLDVKFINDWGAWSYLLDQHEATLAELVPGIHVDIELEAMSIGGLHFNDGTRDIVVFLDNVRVYEEGMPKRESTHGNSAGSELRSG